MIRKAIGILGGMGPMATVDMMRKIIHATPARSDQEHLRILVDCNPQIPNRSVAVFGGGESPGPWLARAATGLQSAGAELLVIACNSAHHWYEDITATATVPVLHIAHETARKMERESLGFSTVGIIGGAVTTGKGLYSRALARLGIQVVVPTPTEQETVDETFFSYKGGASPEHLKAKLLAIADRLCERGATALIAACTEAPLILCASDMDVPLIDATQAVAEEAVAVALGERPFAPYS